MTITNIPSKEEIEDIRRVIANYYARKEGEEVKPKKDYLEECRKNREETKAWWEKYGEPQTDF